MRDGDGDGDGDGEEKLRRGCYRRRVAQAECPYLFLFLIKLTS